MKGDIPDAGLFPQWPCLSVNALKISDAMANGEVRCGREGANVDSGGHVAALRRTVRHTDLREWMAKNYPDQKPEFLFDEIERTTHAAINADTFRALQADRDALKARIEKAEEWARNKMIETKELERELYELRNLTKPDRLDSRKETTYLQIIRALLADAKMPPEPYKAAVALMAAAAAKGLEMPSKSDTIAEKLKAARDLSD